jgi:hypothetical protein
MIQVYNSGEVDILKNEKVQRSVLRALAYFDIFNYPLMAPEIQEYCDLETSDFRTLKFELEYLVGSGRIKNYGAYYYLKDETCILRRDHVNKYSKRLMLKALKYSRIISRFPFVRCVCISGSLSKKSADENADVDYFIITEKNRLWICRTLLALYKKIFLLNSSKYFCINYFVDTNNLEIVDKNIFTATEIAFLVPVFHYENFFRFLASNTWFNRYYARKKIEVHTVKENDRDVFLKRAFEFLINNRFGDFLDDICLKLNILYRKSKFKGMNSDEFRDKMRAWKGVSKHHPNSFQDGVLSKFQKNLARLEAITGIELL